MLDQIKAGFPTVCGSPLIHYCDMLVECMRLKDIEVMKKIIGVYMEELKRDSTFIEYQDRIAKYYFDGKIKQPNMMQ